MDAHTFTKQAEKVETNVCFARKLMTAAVWENKGVLMVEFKKQVTTVTSEV
jgi:hypothetical protein